MPRSKELDICHAEDSPTRTYYEKNADRYFESTLDVDMSALYERFLRYLPEGGRILDTGSGSGRDTLFFLERGYSVEAFDASPKLAELSSRLTGIQTKIMRFQDITATEKYDGIWACAALLHVREKGLPKVLTQFARALKVGGAIYMSFKLGGGERFGKEGRFFTDMDKDRLLTLVKNEPSLNLKEVWITSGEDVFRGKDAWLNAIAVRE